MKNNFGPRKRILFVAGGPLFHQIPLEVGAYIGMITVLLGGSFVVSAGTTSGAFVGENPGAFVASAKVESVAQKAGFRGGVLKNLTARSILRRRSMDRGRIVPDLSLGASGLPGAAGTFTIAQPYSLQFALPRLKDSFQFNTALQCDAYSSLLLTINTNTKAVMNPTTDRTWDTSGMYFDIYDDRAYPTKPGYKTVEMYDTDQPFIINAANSRTPIGSELPQDGAYLDFFACAQTTASLTMSDAVLNRAIWLAGTQQLFDGTHYAIKAQQQRYVSDTAEVQTGVYYMPFDRDGMLASAEAGISGVLDLNNPGGAGLDQLTIASRRINIAPLSA